MIKIFLIIILGIICLILLIGFIIILTLTVFGIKSTNALLGYIKRKLNPKAYEEYIDAEAMNIPERGFSPEEKSKIMTNAISACLSSAQNDEILSADMIDKSLKSCLAYVTDKNSKLELKRVMGLSSNLTKIFSRNPSIYKYSETLLAACLTGLTVLIKNKRANTEEYIVGIMYMLEYMEKNINKMQQILSSVSERDGSEFKEQLEKLIKNIEKTFSLFLIYPQHKSSFEKQVNNIFAQLEEKVAMYSNSLHYGVNTDEADKFRKNIVKTMKDMNESIDNIISAAFSKSIMNADVELEVFRADLRFRGFVR